MGIPGLLFMAPSKYSPQFLEIEGFNSVSAVFSILNGNFFSNKGGRNMLLSHVFPELCFGFECASRCGMY